MGGGLCSWRRQKAPPQQRVKNFWCFPGPGVGGSAAWGAPHHRALVALGRSRRICQCTRAELAEPNFGADAQRRLRRITHTTLSHTPSFNTTLSHTTLSRTNFHTQLCHTPSLTHNFVTHQLLHTIFVNHPLSHTLLHTPCFNTHATLVLRGRRGTWWHPPWFHLAGVAPGDIHLRFAWQAWHSWHWVARLGQLVRAWRRGTLHGRRGTWWHPPWVHVAGVAQSHIHGRFAWQAWHSWHWVARLGPLGRAWRRGTLHGRRGTWWHPPWFHLAGVAQSHIHGRFVWQAWRSWHWVARLGPLGRVWRHNTLRGRRGTWWHPPWFHLAGVPLGHIHLRFAWQAWYLWHCAGCGVTRHLCHTQSFTHLCHTPSFTHHLSYTLLQDSFTHHLRHTTSFTHPLSHPTLSHPIFDTPSFTHHIVTHHLCHTIFHTQICHPLSFTHNFVTHYLSISFTHNFVTHHFVTRHLSHTVLDTPSFTPLCHTPSFTPHFCPTPLCHTPFFTHHFGTHHLSPHHLSHTTLSHTFFHHTIFHTQLCRIPSSATPSFTHHFATHHLSHTTLSPTIFDTPSFTHNFVTHNFVTHTICLCHTPSFTYNFVTHNFALRLSPPPPPLSFLIGTSCLVGLSGPSIFFAFKNTGICSVLRISGLKNIGIYTIYYVFALFPQKTLKRKNPII